MIPTKYFFMFGLDGKHRIAMACMVYALYTMHNELRHNPDRSEMKQSISRIMGEVHLNVNHRAACREVFGWDVIPHRRSKSAKAN